MVNPRDVTIRPDEDRAGYTHRTDFGKVPITRGVRLSAQIVNVRDPAGGASRRTVVPKLSSSHRAWRGGRQGAVSVVPHRNRRVDMSGVPHETNPPFAVLGGMTEGIAEA